MSLGEELALGLCVFSHKMEFLCLFVVPMQIPCKSYVTPIFRPFIGTEAERTYNGPITEVERT